MADAPRKVDRLDHILRPTLPWRTPDQALTECGQPVDPDITIDVDDLAARWRTLGQQRAALTVCMTCFHKVTHASRYITPSEEFDAAPERVLAREIDRVGRARDPMHRALLRCELRALALLVDAHRDEFNQAVTGMGEAADLAAARRRRARGGGVA